jgi:hypothetical protein
LKATLPVRVLPANLAGLDQLSTDVLVLGLFADEKPLRGAAGYCDWRLNSRLSGLLQKNWFQCDVGEVMLTNTNRHIGTERVLLLGQGHRANLNLPALRANFRRMMDVLRRAGLCSFAVELPGVDPGPIPAKEAILNFFEVCKEGLPQARVTLLSPHPRFTDLVLEIAGSSKQATTDRAPLG